MDVEPIEDGVPAIIQKGNDSLYTTETESSKIKRLKKLGAFSLVEGSLLRMLVHSSPRYT